MPFLFGLAIGWFIGRNPGFVQGAAQSVLSPGDCPPGANCFPTTGGSLPIVGGGGVSVGPGPAVGPGGGIFWGGCPVGQVAMQDASGRLMCVPSSSPILTVY